MIKHLNTARKQLNQNLQEGAPVVAQWKWIWLVYTKTQVHSLASLSGLRIWRCLELWCRFQMLSDPTLLWLWGRPAAATLIQLLAGKPWIYIYIIFFFKKQHLSWWEKVKLQFWVVWIFSKNTVPCFWKQNSSCFMTCNSASGWMLEVSNQSSPFATLHWLTQWKTGSPWGTAIASKCHQLSWAEAINRGLPGLFSLWSLGWGGSRTRFLAI